MAGPSSRASRKRNGRRRSINLALQGGGAHGAFTWGVLDRLLEEKDIDIEGISGTSAGAINGAVLATGYAADGPAGAKAALEQFWRRVAWGAQFSPFRRTPLDIALGRWTLDLSPAFIAYDLSSRLLSPYDLNPQGANPLRDILTESVDVAKLVESPIRMFVTATNVRTGRGRVFRNAELTPDVLLASACLPSLFQAILIGNEAYWDGGYSGNPTITPLVRECTCSDTLLVQVNPVERPGTPRSAREIYDRVNEVSFNSPLLKELRMIAVLRQVSDAGNCEGARWARMRLHRVASPLMLDLGASSKLNGEWEFLTLLRDEGRQRASEFLEAHADDIGCRSTLEIDDLLDDAPELKGPAPPPAVATRAKPRTRAKGPKARASAAE